MENDHGLTKKDTSSDCSGIMLRNLHIWGIQRVFLSNCPVFALRLDVGMGAGGIVEVILQVATVIYCRAILDYRRIRVYRLGCQ